MTIEEIIALDKSATERARLMKARAPALTSLEIARFLGCHEKTVYDALLPLDVKREKARRAAARRRQGREDSPSAHVTKIAVEDRGGIWCVLINGNTRAKHSSRADAEREAEWYRWPKREKGKAA